MAVGCEPDYVLQSPDAAALKEVAAAEQPVLFSNRDQAAGELKEALILRFQIPVEPGQLAVLAVGVVVTVLGMAHLVARQEHWNSLGKKQGGQKVAFLLRAQR